MSQIKFYIHSGGKDRKTSLLFHRDKQGNYHVCIHDKIAHSKHCSVLNAQKTTQSIEEENMSKIVGFKVHEIKYNDEIYNPEKIYTDFIYEILVEEYKNIINTGKSKVLKTDLFNETKISGIVGILNKFYDQDEKTFSKDIILQEIKNKINEIGDYINNSEIKEEITDFLKALGENQIPYGSITQEFSVLLKEYKKDYEDFLLFLSEYENNEVDFNFINTVNKNKNITKIPTNTAVKNLHDFFERVIGVKILRENTNFEDYESDDSNAKKLEIDGYKEVGSRYYLVDFKFKRETDDGDLYKSIIYSLFFFDEINGNKEIEEENKKVVQENEIVGLLISPTKENKKENKIEIKKVYQFGKFYFFDIGYPIDKILANEYYDFSAISNIVEEYHKKRSKNKDSDEITLEDGRLITTQRFGFKSLKPKKT